MMGLLEDRTPVLDCLVGESGRAVQLLIGRYLGLAGLMAEEIHRRGLDCRKIEQGVVRDVCGVLSRLQFEDRVFVANKVVNLGHTAILFSALDE